MSDNYSEEIAAVVALCDNGKITPEQRDKLIDALTEHSRVESKIVVDRDDDEDYADVDDETTEDGEGEGEAKFEIHIDNKKSFAEMLSGLGVKIADLARDGVKLAGKAGAQVENALKEAFEGLDVKLGGGRGNVTVDGDEVVKYTPVEYDVPYESLILSVKYESGDDASFNMTLPCGTVGDVRRAAREVMNDKAYARFTELLDSKFTGRYRYVCGSTVMKVTVKKS